MRYVNKVGVASISEVVQGIFSEGLAYIECLMIWQAKV